MNVHALAAPSLPELARALEQFEDQFRYPLGPGRFFHIAHGEDYPRFFRAMGQGVCFVAEREGKILGVIGAALRRLALPDGEERLAWIPIATFRPNKSGRAGGRQLLVFSPPAALQL